MERLCVVTASTSPLRAKPCIQSWGEVPTFCTHNGGDRPYAGVVPTFAAGVAQALSAGYEIIACLHDDVEILDPQWRWRVLNLFDSRPQCGLMGFGGGLGLGDDDLYLTPYRPEQLARKDFRSNMVDAEAHGVRVLVPERVACLDGFSQIGRREYWRGLRPGHVEPTVMAPGWNLFTHMQDAGIVHHFYDGMLGCYAARLGWETWLSPIRCRHLGGQTAVGDPGYAVWAQQQIEGGDAGFWHKAHTIGYEQFRDVLPLRVKE